MNFLWISLTSSRCCLSICCDYIIPYSEAFVNINFYITLYQIWYTYSFFDFAYSISKLNLWILQYDFVNKFWISILDLDFDFVVGFTICTYNRLNLAILYSLNNYKKFKKKTWINASDMSAGYDIIYIQARRRKSALIEYINYSRGKLSWLKESGILSPEIDFSSRTEKYCTVKKHFLEAFTICTCIDWI